MKKLNQQGDSAAFVIATIVSVMLLFFTTVFAIWAYMGRQDYKNNVDQKIDVAVNEALSDQEVLLRAEFAEESKSPYKTFVTDDSLGAFSVTYPKTWDVYVVESGQSNTPVQAYFSPDFVPGVSSDASYSLRVDVVDDTIDKVFETYSGQIGRGAVTVSTYRPANVPNAQAGYRLDGEVAQNRQGSLVLIPVRDKTVKVSTEQQDYIQDFNNIILAQISYNP